MSADSFPPQTSVPRRRGDAGPDRPDRRAFLRRAAIAGATSALAAPFLAGATSPVSPAWRIGCFNRPWYQWSFAEALQSVRTAGFEWLGLLGGHTGDPLIGPGATPEYLAQLKTRIAAAHLTPLVAAFRVDHAKPRGDAIGVARERIENARRLGLEFLLTADEPKPDYYARHVEVMAAAAEFAQQRNIKLVFKPHGSDAATLARLLRDVGHPNFKVWYDAGNILYYTGRDPLDELEPMLAHISGFCAKDCTAAKGEVMIQFGRGRVNFTALLDRFQRGGFRGPILVECCAPGATAAATATNAAANRVFLEKLLARP